jgi:hypothetical protein
LWVIWPYEEVVGFVCFVTVANLGFVCFVTVTNVDFVCLTANQGAGILVEKMNDHDCSFDCYHNIEI